MNYYTLTPSLNNRIVGTYPQVQNVILNCDWENQNFIDNVTFKKTASDPMVANAIIAKDAHLTDLISCGLTGFSSKLLMSGKLKALIASFRKTGLQFYNTPVRFHNDFVNDYWVLNPFELNMEFVDYQKSATFLMKDVFHIEKELTIESYDDYLKLKDALEPKKDVYTIKIENLVLRNDLTEDFFVLEDVEGVVKYYVSDRLKDVIERSGCCGIEFMPSNLILNEWLRPEGKREKIYGNV